MGKRKAAGRQWRGSLCAVAEARGPLSGPCSEAASRAPAEPEPRGVMTLGLRRRVRPGKRRERLLRQAFGETFHRPGPGKT